MTEKRIRFGPSALVVQLNSLSGRLAAGDSPELLDDVPAMIEQQFQLTESQRTGVADLRSDARQIARLKALVIEAANSAGAAQFVVVHRPDNASRSGYLHELRYEKTETTATDARQATLISIAHCDADCENWGWGDAVV
jgi:hypothetical protein